MHRNHALFPGGTFSGRMSTQRLDFSPHWGFGSSSTLISLLAEWAEVNPLDLHFMISDGSGYDVACAIADGPIIYKLRDHASPVSACSFQSPFQTDLFCMAG